MIKHSKILFISFPPKYKATCFISFTILSENKVRFVENIIKYQGIFYHGKKIFLNKKKKKKKKNIYIYIYIYIDLYFKEN